MNSLSRFYLFCVNLFPYSVFLLLTSTRSNTFDCTGWVYLNPMCIRNVWLVLSVQCSVYNIYVTGIAPIGIQLRFILRSECLAILFLIYYLERSYRCMVLFFPRKRRLHANDLWWAVRECNPTHGQRPVRVISEIFGGFYRRGRRRASAGGWPHRRFLFVRTFSITTFSCYTADGIKYNGYIPYFQISCNCIVASECRQPQASRRKNSNKVVRRETSPLTFSQ